MTDEALHSEKFEELCTGYVLNALDEEERREFEQMLREASEEERSFYLEMQSTANQLAFSVEKQDPPATLKEQLLRQIQQENGGQKEAEEKFSWSAFTAAASFALVIISLSLIFYSLTLRSQISKKEAVVKQQRGQITELKNELQQKEEMLSILEAREIHMILMSGMEANPKGYGKIIWTPAKQQALLQVSNLPAAPENKEYQLWIIKSNKPVSAGVFAVRSGGDNFFKIEQMIPADQQPVGRFAVTMEPKGGMPQPTGETYLMGKMDKTN